MRFNSETEAWHYWESAYSLCGGRTENSQWSMFQNWVKDQGVTWLDEEDQKFIEDWDNGI